MIPTVGLMIGGYIILRCVEISCRPKAAFASAGARGVVIALAVLSILATGFCMLGLVFGGLPSTPP